MVMMIIIIILLASCVGESKVQDDCKKYRSVLIMPAYNLLMK